MSGFNLPPGCSVSDIPGNGPFICDCCGATNEDKCVCPECPKCGAHGDLKYYADHGLSFTKAQFDGASAYNRQLHAEQVDEVRRELQDVRAFASGLCSRHRLCEHDRARALQLGLLDIEDLEEGS